MFTRLALQSRILDNFIINVLVLTVLFFNSRFVPRTHLCSSFLGKDHDNISLRI